MGHDLAPSGLLVMSNELCYVTGAFGLNRAAVVLLTAIVPVDRDMPEASLFLKNFPYLEGFNE
jgi:hypothetical protein